VELGWHGALVREEAKWRPGWVVESGKVEMVFYNSEGWESDGPERVAYDGGAYSMI
jgi:hypothetical protein